jgi:hypothetical protein
VRELEDARIRCGISPGEFQVLAVGETRRYDA